jgi:hypothetical protein
VPRGEERKEKRREDFHVGGKIIPQATLTELLKL